MLCFLLCNGLPLTYLSGYWNLVNKTGSFTTNSPISMSTGIRSAGGIILQWVATAGRDYRIYAVPSLSKPFQLLTQLTAATTGATNYTYHPTALAMFYVVEEVPPGY